MSVKIIHPDTFEAQNHWYASAHNATLHPMMKFFLNMSTDQISERYCHLHPEVEKQSVDELLNYKPKFFMHSGTDLIHVASKDGNRKMVVIETNSSPSGQKSMPVVDDFQEMGGYRNYVEQTFKPYLRGKRMIDGALAVIYDKNPMEASGYAHAMADVFKENVFLIPFFNNGAADETIRVNNGVIEFQNEQKWVPIRACFRYVTQKPWNRLPITGKTIVLNPVITCLAGGRNKLVASKAYEMFNADFKRSNLVINTPETIWDVGKEEIPLWVERMGGKAVIKIPYSNAGQGVFTIVNEEELQRFMERDFEYDKFIVQALIGNREWSSEFTGGKLYHVGTVPTKRGKSYAMDVRMIIHYTKEGFKPLSLYSRRAEKPLAKTIQSGEESWSILGTNLSVKEGENQWNSDVSRLLMMDVKGFNLLGVGLDDLMDGFIQSVMATKAIDDMAMRLISSKSTFRKNLFKELNNDASLLNEIKYDK